VKLPDNIPPEVLASHLSARARKARAADDLDEARRCLRAAIYAQPEAARHYYDLGSVRWQAGHRDEAFALFCEALRREPGHAAALENAHAAAAALDRIDELDAFLTTLAENRP
jgi:protein O-GlcNAc transferase